MELKVVFTSAFLDEDAQKVESSSEGKVQGSRLMVMEGIRLMVMERCRCGMW